MEIVGITKNNIDEKTVKMLEELLVKAKSGELKSIVFVDEYRDGTAGHAWCGVPSKKSLGEMEILKFTLQLQYAGISLVEE